MAAARRGAAANAHVTGFNPGVDDVEPGKRSRSSPVPAMIFDGSGRPIVAYGSPGGSTIVNSVLNMTLKLIDHGMSIQDAIGAPRLSVTGANGTDANVNIDTGAPGSRLNGFTQASLEGLRTLGHTVNAPADIGSVQAVVVDARTGKQYAPPTRAAKARSSACRGRAGAESGRRVRRAGGPFAYGSRPVTQCRLAIVPPGPSTARQATAWRVDGSWNQAVLELPLAATPIATQDGLALICDLAGLSATEIPATATVAASAARKLLDVGMTFPR